MCSAVTSELSAAGRSASRRENEVAAAGEPTSERPSRAGSREIARAMRVAVVEDDPVVLGLVNGVLHRMGVADVRAGRSWEAVRDAISSGWADLLVLDLQLPDDSGLAVLERLAGEIPGDEYFPVLVLTADDSPETRERALESGARDFVAKPVAPWELQLRIRNLLLARYYSQRMRRQNERLEVLLDLQRQTLSAPIDDVYQRVLEAAVRTVPGADAGTVLVNGGDGFAFRAAVGYELDALRDIRFSPEDMRTWHGGAPEEWQRANPRILRHDQVDLFAVATAAEVPRALAEHGRLDEIRSNLYLPVVYRGEILAILNLDSFSGPSAFSQGSLEAVRIFAPPVASLLHEANHLAELRQASLTDPLTGLRNRRGFDEAIRAEQARIERHGGSFGVLLLDLDGFKKVNDRLGHAAGDALLKELAAMLDRNRRQEDVIARWGGDEFSVVLPRLTRGGAGDAARRYAELARSIERDGVRLGATVGVSVCPDDGREQEELLRAADRRLYAARAAGLPYLLRPE